MIGNRDDAATASLADIGYADAEMIGHGEARRVYRIDGVVYKVTCRNSANTYEHEALTAWREAGAAWAPETAVYEFDLPQGPEVVLAMPYLPNEGDADEATLAEIRVAAPQTCPENWTTHAGQTYLIDGGDIENWPTA